MALRKGDQARRNREHFPLLPLYTLDVRTSDPPHYDEHGNFVPQPITEFPFMSLIDRLVRFLHTPGALGKMTNVAQYGPVLKEQWHGRVFRENPLFTIDRFRAEDETVYNLGENWLYRDEMGNIHLVLLAGIVQDETGLVDTLKFFVRLYQVGAKPSRSDQPRHAVLTENELVLTQIELCARMVRPVQVEHRPSAHPPPGNARVPPVACCAAPVRTS